LKFRIRVAMREAIVQARNRKKKTITFLASKTNSNNVSLVGVNKTTDVVTSGILLSEQIVLFAKFDRNLTVRRQV
jgi:hypothetical protein